MQFSHSWSAEVALSSLGVDNLGILAELKLQVLWVIARLLTATGMTPVIYGFTTAGVPRLPIPGLLSCGVDQGSCLLRNLEDFGVTKSSHSWGAGQCSLEGLKMVITSYIIQIPCRELRSEMVLKGSFS